MKIRQLLDIQKVVEGRAIPYDIAEGINETTYHSKSKQQHIKIGDMHLHHLLRVFMNNDNLYDAFKQIDPRTVPLELFVMELIGKKIRR